MNILNLLKYSPDFGGGVSKHLLSLGKLIKSEGHKLFIAFPEQRDWQDELSDDATILIIPELNKSFSISLSGIISNICKNHYIDIIHAHFNFGIPFSLATSLKKVRLPLVYHWHNPPLALNEFLTPPDSIKSKLKRFVSSTVARFTDSRTIDLHISISKEITEMLTRNHWTTKDKIIFLPNGIITPKENIYPKKMKSAKPVIVGTVANFRPQKDHETLIRAFNLLLNEGRDVELWIVGDGPTRPSIENLAKELSVSSKIKFLGTVLNPSEIIKEFDIFVLSTHYEGHPLVILEAMSYSIPIIATRISSIPEVVIDKENGLLTNPNDPIDLALAIKTLLVDDIIYDKLSIASGNAFMKQITVEKWASQVLSIYRSLQTKN